MSNPTETFPKTSIAAVAWANGEPPQLRVYTQHLNGEIRESTSDGGSWSFNEKFVIARAKPNSPIAAFKHYQDIHVYYLTDDNFIHEVIWTGSAWTPGTLDEANIQASPISRLAAISYDGDVDCHVFFQQPNGAISFTRRIKGTWVPGSVVANSALTGTGLAALTFKGTDPDGTFNGIRVYYQLPDGTLTEACADRNQDQFFQGDLRVTDASTDTNISAYSYGDNPDYVRIRVFFINSSNWVSEGGYYGNKWHFENHPGETHARPGSGISAIRPRDDKSKLRFFIQDENDQIVEYCTIGDSLLNFTKEAVVPTGNVQ